MEKYQTLAADIIKNVGGKENILGLTHCVTRLRFKLKDEQIAQDDTLKNMDGVVTVLKSAGQYQVVIGNHVPDVYKVVREQAGLSDDDIAEDKKDMTLFAKFFDFISGVMMPSISILAASGIIKGLNTVLAIAGVYAMESSYYVLMNAIGDAMFFFFPIILGFNTAKKMKMNPYLGLMIGAILCYPAINGIDLTFFGYTMNATYTSTVLPVILITCLAAPLERFLNRVIPNAIKTFFVPMLVMLICVPIGFAVIGPLANLVGALIGSGINWLIGLSPIIAGLVLGASWQLLVMFGVHMVLIMPAIMALLQGTPDSLMAMITFVSFTQLGIVFAIWLKTRDQKLKGIALPAWISSIFGVTEPAIYGVTLPRVKMFVMSCIIGGISGGLVALLDLKMFTMAGMGIFALPGLIDASAGNLDNVIKGIAIAVITTVLSFVAAYLFYKENQTELVDDSEKVVPTSNQTEILVSPIKGQLVALKNVEDAAFSEEILGKGVAIEPFEGNVYAPCDGTIMTIFPTKHAIGIISDGGSEILIHLGMDTVKLNGKHFETHVKTGQKIKKGDLLATFDLVSIKEAGYSMISPIIVTNTRDYSEIRPNNQAQTNVGDDLLTLSI